ncbi:hypothetical protein Aph01nite_35850 [Acrocarpospora phusangensis]|uniref:Carrier domain-containing protein n=1 Tax=Acrocarpospora phusangensis TaxID=1070424 RepID=A0A919QDA6_9ACTN|nr:non-ribosomal peptide synthetase [Acrocarpospora phusangensis]GIH25275.1 hypothetical protein Aph01nite_35850 [Acrocarpospora phusangensis]
MTVLPSWRSTAAGTPAARRTLPAGVARLADALDVPVEQVLLAAHLVVLARLTGQRTVCTRRDGRCHRLDLPATSWRELIGIAGELTGQDLADCDAAFGGVARAGLTLSWTPGTLEVRLAPDRFGDDHAERVAGYHLAALSHLVADPDAAHDDADLLDAAERHLQIHDLAGPARELPAKGVAELVAEQAALHPDRLAVRAPSGSWTYAALDTAAAHVAGGLHRAGLAAEDVVAVVMRRDLPWAAAVLGILRAGGVYLPIDPLYPPERIAMLLRRSGCRWVLADDGVAPLEQALGEPGLEGVRRVLPCPGDAPPVPVAADRLAYIYFTSGSTGQPKGAMCEHGGMINHLLAKIEDLELGPDDVVVQNAPQCFDISLWQLCAPLLVGGRTLIIGPDDLVDLGKFCTILRAEGASVLQVVPSYLDVLLTEESVRDGDLGMVRCVSVTGEAVSRALVRRWFAAFPGIPLVNAYGATESSDDATHAILRTVPPNELVPVGRPVPNVAVSVLDERRRLVPLGTPGEIVFSGVCVGRGYVNDPERTRESFVPDPLRPGQAMYRTGDIGRWTPGGVLEYLGRRDQQVKIRGMRVEVGEVENRLLAVPGVNSGVVLVRDDPSGVTLLAFYTGEELAPDRVRDTLGAVLPAHMVPAHCLRVADLPLTENGKVDRRALFALADRSLTGVRQAPATSTERLIAKAWAEVLGRSADQVSTDEDFFAVGGNSLAAVRLVVRLDGLVSLVDITERPVLADLAAVAEGER